MESSTDTDLYEGDPSSTLLDQTSCMTLTRSSCLQNSPTRSSNRIDSSRLLASSTTISMSSSLGRMGRVRMKTMKKSSRQVIERYYSRMTIDFPHEQEGSGGSGECALDQGPSGGPNQHCLKKIWIWRY
ncbi:Ribosomal protein S17e [Sesbania bispinosa]|nr:Ribosomal protein S17e [Sesbania bispinosa]